MKTNITHSKRQVIKHRAIQTGVMTALRMSEELYNRLMFENAYAYLKNRKLDENGLAYTVLVRSPFFWQWWKNQYYIIDEKFLADITTDEYLSLTIKEMTEEYMTLHIETQIYPERSLLHIIYQPEAIKKVEEEIART